MPPLGRPLYEPSHDTRIATAHRELQRLKRRGAGRWVYPGGVPAGDPGGVDGSGSYGWQNSWGDTGDGSSVADGLTRYRFLLGGGLELAINAAGGEIGTVMFSLLENYWFYGEGKQTFAAVDDNGDFACYTIVPQPGNLTVAGVYAGRV